MIEPQKAAFKFINFKVPHFSYNESKKSQVDLKLLFNPTGKYFPNEGKFELTVTFSGIDENSPNDPIIKVIGIGEFEFSNTIPFEDIPEFFYSTSIPILFPYLRSFISTLTLQANTGIITLGLMNFTTMAGLLKDNTTIEEASN